jgi:hypothetical protein
LGRREGGVLPARGFPEADIPRDGTRHPNLLHGGEPRFYGDSAYRGKAQRERLKDIAPKAKDFTNKRAYKNRPLTDADKATNRRKSSELQGRASLPHAQASLGFCQSSLSWLGEERQPRLCYAGNAQHQQMGTTAHRRGASSMSKMTGNYPHQGLKRAIYLMKTRFSSRFRFDLPLPPLVAGTCSALP